MDAMAPAEMMDAPAEQPDENQNLLEKENQPEEEEEYDDEGKRIPCECCCCLCACRTEKTKDITCLGCFPIRCGIVAIGATLLFLTVTTYCEVFYMFLNEYIHWWYTVIAILLLVPLLIASTFYVVFYSENTESTRGRLSVSCYLTIISYSLLAIWNLIYF